MSDLDDLLKDDDTELVSFIPTSAPTPQGPRGGSHNDDSHSNIPNNDLQELRDQLAAQAAEIKRLSIPTHTPSYNAPVQQQYQQPTNTNVPGSHSRAQLKEQLQNAYLSDPAEAMLSLYEMAKKEAVAEARLSMVPVAGQTTRFAIDQYRKSAGFLTDENEEFDHLISQISEQDMANANPAMLSKQLEILKYAARGAALEKRASKPQPRVPMYSAGSVPSGNSGSKVNVKLTKGQKAFWDMGIENGLKPEQIMEVINGDDGQGGIS
jgi:hypothetical protein